MKAVLKARRSRNLLFVGIALAVFGLIVALAFPAPAIESRYQSLLDQGVIHQVSTPSQLGFDYLQQEPPRLMAARNRDELLDAIYEAESEVSVMPEDIQLAFDLGTNSPVSIDRDDSDPDITRSNVQAIGYVSHAGEGKPFTASELVAMFSMERANDGDLPLIPVDLIVLNRRTDDVSILTDVNANALCRDALNAVLNDSVRRTTRSDLFPLW
jgi:hypothetical protein